MVSRISWDITKLGSGIFSENLLRHAELQGEQATQLAGGSPQTARMRLEAEDRWVYSTPRNKTGSEGFEILRIGVAYAPVEPRGSVIFRVGLGILLPLEITTVYVVDNSQILLV